MKPLTKLTLNIEELKNLTENIASVEDNSDSLFRRVAITFKNGLGLSIIQGEYSYGGPQGLFEIAPKNKEGELDGSLFDEEDQGEDVLGHCTVEQLNHYINKIGNINTTKGIQNGNKH